MTTSRVLNSQNSISVVVPTFNRGSQIQETLDSVLNQTLAPLEIIVVDDGSTDDTLDWIAAHYGDKVRIIRQENGGVARARNRGLQEARGELIAFLDHDDIWHPEKLAKQYAALAHPEIGVVYCGWSYKDAQNHLDSESFTAFLGVANQWPQGFVFKNFLKRNYIVSMSVPLIRTQLVRDVNGFDPAIVPCDDWDLWLKLAQNCRFAFVSEDLVIYYQHEKQQSRDGLAMVKAEKRLMFKYLLPLLFSPTALWLHLASTYFFYTLDPYYYSARKAVAEANWQEVRRQLLLCVLRKPLIVFVPQWIYVVKRLITRDSRRL